MTAPRIHQFSPRVEPGAVASHTRIARDLLRAAGHESEIFAGAIAPECFTWGVRDVREYGRAYKASDEDQLIYQMAIGSPVADFLLRRTEPLIVNHHNLTPRQYLDGWDPTGAFGVLWGRRQLRALAKRARLGIAVSHYNELDLVEAGFRETVVVPFLLDPADLERAPDPDLLGQLQQQRASSGASWLFVGRLAANKAQHDLIKALAVYRRFADPRAHLHLVGGGLDTTYGRALREYSTALGVADAVHFPGGVSSDALAAYYASADVFVSCSEHEGFCVPIIEAMARGLPVVAYAAAAVPETAGAAAILLDDKHPEMVAAAVERLLADGTLRSHLVEAGRARVRAYDTTETGRVFIATLNSVAAR
jgi:L-malate glycosyltransferase